MIIPKATQALGRLKGTLLAEGYWQDVLEDFAIIENALNEYYRLLKEDDETTKKLKRLEELEKAFDALSKDDEKAKKLLSLEIEKNRAFEIIKEKKVDVPYIIENPEEKDVIWYNARFMGVLCEGWRMLSQKEWDLVRKALL